MHPDVLKNCPLFHKIPDSASSYLLEELRAYTRAYPKESWVAREGKCLQEIGVLLSGRLQLSQDDPDGNRMLLDTLEPSDVFGEVFALHPNTTLPIDIQATQDTEILWLPVSDLLSSPSSTQIIHNLLQILAEKNLHLRNRIHILSARSLRQKLLRYFHEIAHSQHSSIIRLPHDRQGLADVLCVDRSALSRELSRMREEGILDYDRSLIHLKQFY